MLLDMWRETSVLGLFGVVVALATAVIGIAYAWRPTEGKLALVRPLSLATIFAALCSFSVSAAIILKGIAVTGELTAGSWQSIAAGAAETFVALFVSSGCLAIAWLGVASGLKRTS